jgi:hypothetical protein
VSKKRSGIRLVAIELEVGGKSAAEGAQTLQQLLASRFACDAKASRVGDMDFDLIALG